MDSSTESFLYLLFLSLHNLLRWATVIVAIWALVRAFGGWLQKRAWEKNDDRAGLFFTSLMDTQLLVGIVLYFLFSPWTAQLFANFSGAMKGNRNAAFFGMEHVGLMVLAVVAAHVGRALSRKAVESLKKHRTAAIWYSISILMVLAAIPWPGMATGRPLFRLFGISF